MNSTPGSTTYDGLTLTARLKIESATIITYTTPAVSTLTLVFDPTFVGTIKLNNVSYTASAGVVVIPNVPAGLNTITKGSVANLFYIKTAYPLSKVNLKLFIQAYYEVSTMRPVRFNQDGVSPMTDVETITVELHSTTAPYDVLHTTTTMLHTDGTAEATFSSSPTGSFYISINCRNAIKTWSATPQTIGGTTSYDFSNAQNKAYGNNMVSLGGGKFAFYSGDINGDGSIDGSDAPYLLNDVDNSLFGAQITDLNGDGSVDNSDIPFYSDNTDASIYSHDPNNP